MGKRARRRAREHAGQVNSGRLEAAAASTRAPSVDGPTSLERLRELVVARHRLTRSIEDLVDELASDGVGWVPIAHVLGVSRQATRQAYLKRVARLR